MKPGYRGVYTCDVIVITESDIIIMNACGMCAITLLWLLPQPCTALYPDEEPRYEAMLLLVLKLMSVTKRCTWINQPSVYNQERIRTGNLSKSV